MFKTVIFQTKKQKNQKNANRFSIVIDYLIAIEMHCSFDSHSIFIVCRRFLIEKKKKTEKTKPIIEKF